MVTATAMVRRSALTAVGGWSEELRSGLEVSSVFVSTVGFLLFTLCIYIRYVLFFARVDFWVKSDLFFYVYSVTLFILFM